MLPWRLLYSQSRYAPQPSHFQIYAIHVCTFNFPTHLQVPSHLLDEITRHCNCQDLAHLRLSCRLWRDKLPTKAFTHRVTLQYQSGWEVSAQRIRELCPSLVVVLAVSNTKHLHSLVVDPLCDIVSCSPLSKNQQTWDLAIGEVVANKATELLQLLSPIQQVLADPTLNKRVELRLGLKAGVVQNQEAQAVIAQVQAAVSELRVEGNLTVCAAQVFPIIGLRDLAFVLPAKPKLSQYWDAVACLPNLTSLHVYTHSPKANSYVPRFLEVLPSLCRVKVLQVATWGQRLCLSAHSLQHVTQLQLGSGVTIDHLPACLRTLRLQALHTYVEGYLTLFSEVQQQHQTLDLLLDAFTDDALLQLPTNLSSLSLLQPLEQASCTKPCIQEGFNYHLAFAQMSSLQVLIIADFLTPYVSYVLEGLVMKRLHTFGFGLASESVPEEERQMDSGRWVFTAAHPRPVYTFPNLECIIVYGGSEWRTKPATLDCRWMDRPDFTKLRHIVCYCPKSLVKLDALPTCCRAVFRHIKPPTL